MYPVGRQVNQMQSQFQKHICPTIFDLGLFDSSIIKYGRENLSKLLDFCNDVQTIFSAGSVKLNQRNLCDNCRMLYISNLFLWERCFISDKII